MNFHNSFQPIRSMDLSRDIECWNTFVDLVSKNDIDTLPMTQRAAALVFWYDSEVSNGGHSCYFDCYPQVTQAELVTALNEVGASVYVQNVQQAFLAGKNDEYVGVDERFGAISPSLIEILQKYVVMHANDLEPWE